MAVVHHNTDERRDFDSNSLHGLLPPSGTLYVARKYIYATPISQARRIALPLYALPFGGSLPRPVRLLYSLLVEKLGEEQGNMWFDKVCVFLPLLFVLMGVQYGAEAVQKKMKTSAAPVEASSGDKKKRKKQ